jgi:hypothetical protein
MRSLAFTMKDQEIIVRMTDLASDYDKLADRPHSEPNKINKTVHLAVSFMR